MIHLQPLAGRLPFILACLAIGFAFNGRSLGQEEQAEPVSFAREILPILSNKCFVCHGPDSRQDDLLRLDSFEGATADLGGYQAIDPDTPDDSEILFRIHDESDPMPPLEADKHLTDQEKELLTRWVQAGGSYAKHWAFVVPQKIEPTDRHEQETVIDAYIRMALEKQGHDFADEADRATLARRASLVLTGLPPEPEWLTDFLNDDRPGAYERFVDRLLESHRYGEHQARYWLDAIRYGDTHGLHLDNRRGIYPYRDWIVRAFNRNLPLDQFIQWQLAGDLFEQPTLEQRVATGFVRMNPSTSEGGAIAAEFQAKNNFDRTETLGTVLLGMTMTCARCHTHKYDPITQTEYYELLAFFNSTSESAMDGNAYEYGPVARAPSDQPSWDRWDALNNELDALLASAGDVIESLESEQVEEWNALQRLEKLERMVQDDGWFATSDLQASALTLKASFDALSEQFTTTLVAVELDSPRETRILERGEYNLPVGDTLAPDVPSIMGEIPEQLPRNRLGLAQWLTSREHPLVSRVLINRIWQRTFGVGLVRTPEDFGLQGQQPTHPELLDWLAVELQDSGWNLKHMLRSMVTSRAFRQISAWRDGMDDPENRLFGRGPSHRLDAEVLRDIALWTSGMLIEYTGGEGVKPYQPAGMWNALAHPASNTKHYVQDQGDKLYHRTLYVYWKRTSPHPMMTLFDAPDRESSCVRRSRTNTALQSLGLFNETQRIELARKLAERLVVEEETDAARLDRLYHMIACRSANDVERTALLDLYSLMQRRYSTDEAAALEFLSIGQAPRDETLDSATVAAWCQVAIVVLASDAAILLY